MHIQDLASAPGQQLLAELPVYDAAQVFSLHNQLRKRGFDSDLISAALTQSRLRARATEKFGDSAAQMLFTAAGLEQATRASIATAHADFLRKHGAQKLLDFGCGIGADARSFAAAGITVTAIEKDGEAAAAARHNLAAFPTARVIEADANDLDLAALGADTVWIDPARRSAGKRIKNPAHWQPSLEHAIALAQRYPLSGIKVAPGIDYALLPASAHVQWISETRELAEAVIWMGVDIKPGRSALVITPNGKYSYQADGENPQQPAEMLEPAPLAEFIYEPDPAIIRAGAIASLAKAQQLRPVSAQIAYLTGVDPIFSPFLSGFRIQEVLKPRPKIVQAALRSHGIGRVEIKKRGTSLVPEEYRRQLHLDSSLPGSATLISTPLAGKPHILLCSRLQV